MWGRGVPPPRGSVRLPSEAVCAVACDRGRRPPVQHVGGERGGRREDLRPGRLPLAVARFTQMAAASPPRRSPCGPCWPRRSAPRLDLGLGLGERGGVFLVISISRYSPLSEMGLETVLRGRLSRLVPGRKFGGDAVEDVAALGATAGRLCRHLGEGSARRHLRPRRLGGGLARVLGHGEARGVELGRVRLEVPLQVGRRGADAGALSSSTPTVASNCTFSLTKDDGIVARTAWAVTDPQAYLEPVTSCRMGDLVRQSSERAPPRDLLRRDVQVPLRPVRGPAGARSRVEIIGGEPCGDRRVRSALPVGARRRRWRGARLPVGPDRFLALRKHW
jgi:hypothetical protein